MTKKVEIDFLVTESFVDITVRNSTKGNPYQHLRLSIDEFEKLKREASLVG